MGALSRELLRGQRRKDAKSEAAKASEASGQSQLNALPSAAEVMASNLRAMASNPREQNIKKRVLVGTRSGYSRGVYEVPRVSIIESEGRCIGQTSVSRGLRLMCKRAEP